MVYRKKRKVYIKKFKKPYYRPPPLRKIAPPRNVKNYNRYGPLMKFGKKLWYGYNAMDASSKGYMAQTFPAIGSFAGGLYGQKVGGQKGAGYGATAGRWIGEGLKKWEESVQDKRHDYYMKKLRQ